MIDTSTPLQMAIRDFPTEAKFFGVPVTGLFDPPLHEADYTTSDSMGDAPQPGQLSLMVADLEELRLWPLDTETVTIDCQEYRIIRRQRQCPKTITLYLREA